MKKIFIIDWILIPLFVFSAYTGVGLHIAGHGNNHEMWHNWAVFHIATSLLVCFAGTLHVTTHWGWYKGLINNGTGRKSKITLGISAAFMVVVVTGVILLNVNGANSNIGLWHYKIGLLTSTLAIVHILKRIPILRKSLKR